MPGKIFRNLLCLLAFMAAASALRLNHQTGGKLMQQFEKEDRDGDGQLSLEELGNYIGDKEKARREIEVADKGHDGKISKKQFFAHFYLPKAIEVLEEGDQDDDDLIDWKEAKAAFEKKGFSLTDPEYQRLVHKVDKDHDGKMSYAELETVANNGHF